MRSLFSLIPALLLVLAACGGEPGDAAAPDTAAVAEEVGAMQGAPPAGTADDAVAEAVEPEMEDGVQVVHVEAGVVGYDPARIVLKTGVPARLVFTRTTDSACMEKVQFPAFGVEKTDLPLDEPVAIEFTPEVGGEYTFACGMDMTTGTVLVKS